MPQKNYSDIIAVIKRQTRRSGLDLRVILFAKTEDKFIMEKIILTFFAVKSFRIYLCIIVFSCINKAAFIFLQAMGKAVASTVLSVVREIVFGVGFALLLPIFFGLDGVLYSMPAADILTAFFSAAVIGLTYKELKQ